MNIFCCECASEVTARLTDGREIYPHRPDLATLPFWKCLKCSNYVGCCYKTADRTRPLGCIPNATIRNARQHIHKLIDPVWKSGRITREVIYQHLSEMMGSEYHTANIRTIEEARAVYRIAKNFIKNIKHI